MGRVELQIDDVALGGDGVGRHHGKAVFVPFTVTGETVVAEIVREKKQYAHGELLRVLQPSPHRVEPECPYFGRCGGCSYQHMDYQHQLAVKENQVAAAILRIGRLDVVPVQPIVPSPLQYGYRNRITVHADGGRVGYYQRGGQRLIDVTECPIAVESVNAALAALRSRQPREGHFTLRAAAGPRVFRQTNDGVAAKLLDLVVAFIPGGTGLVVDAYCGAGFFAKALRDRCDRVVGIDWDRFGIEVANKDATERETYIAGDVGAELGRILDGARAEHTAVIVDPPATGLDAAVRDKLVKFRAATLAYVSCNPATLARDLRHLHSAYHLLSVTPLDMFPQTAEIEVAVHCAGRR